MSNRGTILSMSLVFVSSLFGAEEPQLPDARDYSWRQSELSDDWSIKQLAPCNRLSEEVLAEAAEGWKSEEWLSVSSMAAV